MVRIAIVDDERDFAKRVEEITVQFFHEKKVGCKTVIYHMPQELLWDMEDGYSYDIYLMDIEMPVVSGLDLAHAIRQKHDEPYIIFITAHLEYSIEGYEYNAWRYIMKSGMKEKLLPAFEQMMERWEREPEKFYFFQNQSKISKVACNDIYYLHKDGKYTIFYTKQGIFKERSPIAKVWGNLDTTEFIFSDRAYIVNLRHVIRLGSNTVVMRDGTEVPSSCQHFHRVKEAIKKYWSF